jgi:hypothetical protein
MAVTVTEALREALTRAGLPTASESHPSSSAASSEHRRQKVLIWQADGGKGHDLGFMYHPVMSTLVDGFHTAPSRPRVISGHGMHWLRSQLRMHRGLEGELTAGDVFIWIGPIGSDVPPWRALRRRGVRTVFYQTEPLTYHTCSLGQSQPEELWEFSWHNFDVCAKKAFARCAMCHSATVPPPRRSWHS